jgi:uncharacterized protein (TIGR02246 family)
MAANGPEECDLQIAACINAGDPEGAAALYEADARFVAGPDSTLEGIDAIREVMRGMVAGKARLTIDVSKVVQAGDLAMVCSKWSSTVTNADGKETTDTGNGREVVRRQADGTWRFVIDYPNGGD